VERNKLEQEENKREIEKLLENVKKYEDDKKREAQKILEVNNNYNIKI